MIPTYIAAPFYMQEAVEELADELCHIGFKFIGRWTQEEKLSVVEFLNKRMWAHRDLDDIKASEVFILIEPQQPWRSHGREVEYGYALALGIECWIVGPPENIFYYIDGVQHFATIEEMLTYARRRQEGR